MWSTDWALFTSREVTTQNKNYGWEQSLRHPSSRRACPWQQSLFFPQMQERPNWVSSLCLPRGTGRETNPPTVSMPSHPLPTRWRWCSQSPLTLGLAHFSLTWTNVLSCDSKDSSKTDLTIPQWDTSVSFSIHDSTPVGPWPVSQTRDSVNALECTESHWLVGFQVIIELVFQLFCEFENKKLGRGMYVNVSTFMLTA